MSNYRYDSIDGLRSRYADFTRRLHGLEGGATTDENGVEYTDPGAQADWFREQLALIGAELAGRA